MNKQAMKRLICWFFAAVMILCILAALTGCSKVEEDVNVYADTSIFICCERSSATKPFSIVYHKDTKVMYAVSAGGYNTGTFTLLVNPDGSPMLWEG